MGSAASSTASQARISELSNLGDAGSEDGDEYKPDATRLSQADKCAMVMALVAPEDLNDVSKRSSTLDPDAAEELTRNSHAIAQRMSRIKREEDRAAVLVALVDGELDVPPDAVAHADSWENAQSDDEEAPAAEDLVCSFRLSETDPVEMSLPQSPLSRSPAKGSPLRNLSIRNSKSGYVVSECDESDPSPWNFPRRVAKAAAANIHGAGPADTSEASGRPSASADPRLSDAGVETVELQPGSPLQGKQTPRKEHEPFRQTPRREHEPCKELQQESPGRGKQTPCQEHEPFAEPQQQSPRRSKQTPCKDHEPFMRVSRLSGAAPRTAQEECDETASCASDLDEPSATPSELELEEPWMAALSSEEKERLEKLYGLGVIKRSDPQERQERYLKAVQKARARVADSTRALVTTTRIPGSYTRPKVRRQGSSTASLQRMGSKEMAKLLSKHEQNITKAKSEEKARKSTRKRGGQKKKA